MIRWVDQKEILGEILKQAEKNKSVSVDLEFNSKYSYYETISLIQMAINDKIYVIDIMSLGIAEELISLFKETHPYREIIGFGGVDSDIIDRLRAVEMPMSWYDKVFELGNKIGQFSYYVPHTMKQILNQQATVYGQGSSNPGEPERWHPEDNLFVRIPQDEAWPQEHVPGVHELDHEHRCDHVP